MTTKIEKIESLVCVEITPQSQLWLEGPALEIVRHDIEILPFVRQPVILHAYRTAQSAPFLRVEKITLSLALPFLESPFDRIVDEFSLRANAILDAHNTAPAQVPE